MKTKTKVICNLLLLMCVFINQAKAQIPGSKIGSFDLFSDIGVPEISGTACVLEPSQV